MLRDLVSKVLDSGSTEAAENLDGLLSEFNRDSPRKNILNSLFNGIVVALPSLVSATDIVENIRKIIAGA